MKPTSFLKSPFLTLNKVSEHGRYEKHRVDWKSSSSKVASGLPFVHAINRLISDQALESADELKVIPRIHGRPGPSYELHPPPHTVLDFIHFDGLVISMITPGEQLRQR